MITRLLYPLFAVIISLLLVSFMLQFYNAFALSPPFSRVTAQDDEDTDNVDDKNNLTLFKLVGNLPIDILSTSYVSDGRTLNGTLWLSNPLHEKNHTDYVDSNLTFSMMIYTPEDLTFEFSYPTYFIYIKPERDGTWTKETWEEEPYHPDISEYAKRMLVPPTQNHSDFFQDGNRYVDLSVDLQAMGFPDEYGVSFSTSANKSGTFLEDSDLVGQVPLAELVSNFGWPTNPIELRRGEERSIIIPVNYSEFPLDEEISLTDANKNDSITVNFNPQPLYMSEKNGKENKTNMQIKADAQNPGTYDIYVTVNSMSKEGVPGEPFNETFKVEILPPLTNENKISIFLQDHPDFPYLIAVGITSIFAIWLFLRVDIKSHKPEWIRVKDILTIDASVIAGVLVFLSVGASEVFSGKVVQQTGILTASIVFPFAIAAMRTLIKGYIEEYGIKFMLIGFVYLMLASVESFTAS